MTKQSNGTILVIDDNPLVLSAVTLLLEENHFTPLVYSSASDVINISGKIQFDAVLSDIKMPEISGITLMEKIHCVHPDMPVILMTAYAELNTAIDAIKKGAFDFIIKPFVPEHLTNTIQRAVDHTRFKESELRYKRKLENVVHQKTLDLKNALKHTERMSRELVQRLTKMSEYRDTDTGEHISRIGLYSNKLAEALLMSKNFVDAITLASSMHDLGKSALLIIFC